MCVAEITIFDGRNACLFRGPLADDQLQVGRDADQVADDQRGRGSFGPKHHGLGLERIDRPFRQTLEVIPGHGKAEGRRDIDFRDPDAQFRLLGGRRRRRGICSARPTGDPIADANGGRCLEKAATRIFEMRAHGVGTRWCAESGESVGRRELSVTITLGQEPCNILPPGRGFLPRVLPSFTASGKGPGRLAPSPPLRVKNFRRTWGSTEPAIRWAEASANAVAKAPLPSVIPRLGFSKSIGKSSGLVQGTAWSGHRPRRA